MKKGRVFDNNKIGIYLLGVGSEPMIEDVIIDNNKGPGVKVGVANKAQISACVIRFNRYGVGGYYIILCYIILYYIILYYMI